MTHTHARGVLIAVLAILATLGGLQLVRSTMLRPTTITAYFASATGIYKDDDVRVAGVRVGTISSITPAGDNVRFTLKVDRDVPIPADAKAVVVAQNLISARYVQLAPGYDDNGPVMADGAVIPLDRTAVPVEWDEVKTQLTRLATDLGPRSGVDGTAVARFIDSAASALDGNGEKLRTTLSQLSAFGRTLASHSGDLVATVKNLQKLVSALQNSTVQIVEFEDRFATLTSVVNNSRSDLDSALTQLSQALSEVQQFIAGTRDKASEQVQRLVDVTQNLVDHQMDLKNLLHVAPNAISNANRIYNPNDGAIVGSFVMNNFENPVDLICGSIGAVKNVTSTETAKLCAQYLGPALRLLNFNLLPFPFNAFLSPSPRPEKVIYSDPKLAPGGAGPSPAPPELPPAISAYMGAGDEPPPAGWDRLPGPPGIRAPNGLPAPPEAPLLPGAPIPIVTVTPTPPPSAAGLSGLLLPEGPPERPAAPTPAPGS